MERIQKDLGDRLQMSREELGAIKNQMRGEKLLHLKLGKDSPSWLNLLGSPILYTCTQATCTCHSSKKDCFSLLILQNYVDVHS